MKFITLSIVALLLAVVTIRAQQNPMVPGLWETTMQLQMANMPMQMPEMKSSSCITAEDLAEDPTTGLPRGARNGGPNQCKVTDYTFNDDSATWKIMCGGPMAMSGEGQMTFTDDTYAGTMTMDTPQGAMSMQLTGKRVGDCTPTPPTP